MNRRELLKMSLALPAVALRPASVGKSRPKLERLKCSIGPVECDTGWIPTAKARQKISDAIRDMSTVLGQGKKYPERPEPEWLTEAVERNIAEARAQAVADRKWWLRRELEKL